MRNGCSYGRGTRWGVGIIMTILLAIVLAAVSLVASGGQRIEDARGALDVRIRENTDGVHETREIVGRMDERLKSIDAALLRIEEKVSER